MWCNSYLLLYSPVPGPKAAPAKCGIPNGLTLETAQMRTIWPYNDHVFPRERVFPITPCILSSPPLTTVPSTYSDGVATAPWPTRAARPGPERQAPLLPKPVAADFTASIQVQLGEAAAPVGDGLHPDVGEQRAVAQVEIPHEPAGPRNGLDPGVCDAARRQVELDEAGAVCRQRLHADVGDLPAAGEVEVGEAGAAAGEGADAHVGDAQGCEAHLCEALAPRGEGLDARIRDLVATGEVEAREAGAAVGEGAEAHVGDASAAREIKERHVRAVRADGGEGNVGDEGAADDLECGQGGASLRDGPDARVRDLVTAGEDEAREARAPPGDGGDAGVGDPVAPVEGEGDEARVAGDDGANARVGDLKSEASEGAKRVRWAQPAERAERVRSVCGAERVRSGAEQRGRDD